jgi:hypothetical protein
LPGKIDVAVVGTGTEHAERRLRRGTVLSRPRLVLLQHGNSTRHDHNHNHNQDLAQVVTIP